MLKVRWMLACEQVIPRSDGRIDMVGVLEDLHAPSLPFTLDTLTVTASVQFNHMAHAEVKVDIQDTEGDVLYEAMRNYPLTGAKGIVRLDLTGVKLIHPGLHTVNFYWKDQLLRSTIFTVVAP